MPCPFGAQRDRAALVFEPPLAHVNPMAEVATQPEVGKLLQESMGLDGVKWQPAAGCLVRHSGGHIHVYSEVGKGTTFKIYLPIVAEAAPVVPAHRETASVQSGSECILLAEDEEGIPHRA